MDDIKTLLLKMISVIMSLLVGLGFTVKPEKQESQLSRECIFELNTHNSQYSYAQGACADDEYIYILMNDNSMRQDTKSLIFKIDPIKRAIVAESKPLSVCCGCDMTYNRFTKELIVVNNRPLSSTLSVVDAETLKLKRSFDLGFNAYGIAFDDRENIYYIANSGGQIVTVLSSAFKKIRTVCVKQSDYTWESICSLDEYIYLLGSAPNVVRIYDKKGSEYKTLELPEKNCKPAALVFFNGNFFVTYLNAEGGCSLCLLSGFSGFPNNKAAQEVMIELPIVNGYKSIQGGCCSDKYVYQLMNDSVRGKSAVYVIDPKTWTVAFKAENLSVDHGNDMCWNSKTNEIVIAHNMPNRNLVSFFDAATLKYKRTKDIGEEIFSLDYDRASGCYYAGLSYSKQYVVFSADFSEKKFYSMKTNGYTKQGMTSDEKNLYFVFYDNNCFRVYSKSGKFVKEYTMPVTIGEAENAFFYDGNFYVAYNKADYTGGLIFKLNEFQRSAGN